MIKSSLEDDLVDLFIVHDQGWPTGFQLGSYQMTDLVTVNTLFLLLQSNPLSFLQDGKELYFA